MGGGVASKGNFGQKVKMRYKMYYKMKTKWNEGEILEVRCKRYYKMEKKTVMGKNGLGGEKWPWPLFLPEKMARGEWLP